MQREILITDLTAMSDDNVCLAGIDRDWCSIRPVFARGNPQRSHLLRGGQAIIRPRAIVSMHLEPPENPQSPHSEDFLWISPRSARFVKLLDEARWQKALEQLARTAPQPLFGAALWKRRGDRGRVLMPGQARHSLATARCAGKLEYRFRRKERGGGFRHALYFGDAQGDHHDNIPVTDLALQAYAQAQFHAGAAPQAVSEELTTALNAAEYVFLRLGLGRLYEGKFWLQVNGIYSFPDYLGGRCFADFAVD